MTLPMRKEAACPGCSNENLNTIYTGQHKTKKASSTPKPIGPFPSALPARVWLDVSCLDTYGAIINSHRTNSIHELLAVVLCHWRKGKAACVPAASLPHPRSPTP